MMSGRMWDDNTILLAYLITFRCYGTWLHGDERGSIDRFHNRYQSPYLPANQKWQRYNAQKLKQELVTLNDKQRAIVENAIREDCAIKLWALLAINVRTNHVHVVASVGETPPSRVLNSFKTNATRVLRETGSWRSPHSPWSDSGSKRYLWTEESVQRAIEYVINGQGGPLPDFN